MNKSRWSEIRNHHDEIDGAKDAHDLVKCIAIDAKKLFDGFEENNLTMLYSGLRQLMKNVIQMENDHPNFN